MTCFYPTNAWQSIARDTRGKSEIVFRPPTGNVGFGYKEIKLPCGRCVGCRLARSRDWAIRCMHEASMFERNCFITLTYSPDNLPEDGSLDLKHFQDFMKRLRKRFNGHQEVTDRDGVVHKPIRFYHCGEYGDLRGRPHYHACIFNFDFEDKVFSHCSPSGERLYRSKALEELWTLGFSSIGSVTFQSAGYVARYIMKKVLGKDADAHYFDPSTGVYKRPEYTTMSRRPGIGYNWFRKYSADVFPRDGVIVNGKKMPVPKYYDRLVESFDVEAWNDIKNAREEKQVFSIDNADRPSLDSQRLNVEARLNRFKRSVD